MLVAKDKTSFNFEDFKNQAIRELWISVYISNSLKSALNRGLIGLS